MTNNYYLGFVEDNVDPMKVGRCKVRIVGLYDSLSKSDLPWIQPMIPLNHDVVYPPKIGTQVICIALDEYNQVMLMIGAIPGINDATNAPDTTALARNDADDKPSIITKIDSNLTPWSSFGEIVGGIGGIDFSAVQSVANATKSVLDGEWGSILSSTLLTDSISQFSDNMITDLKEQMGDIFPIGATEDEKTSLINGGNISIGGTVYLGKTYQDSAIANYKSALNVSAADIASGNLPQGVTAAFASSALTSLDNPTLLASFTGEGLTQLNSAVGGLSAVNKAFAAIGGFTKSEPSFGYATEYPNSKVEATSGGFTIQDSTPGKEMISTILNNGSYEKISSVDGSSVKKTIGDNVQVNAQDSTTITTGTHSLSASDINTIVDGTQTEIASIRHINAAAGTCNMKCFITGSPYHFFG